MDGKGSRMRTLRYPGLGYEVEVRKTKGRMLALAIYPNNRIILRVPSRIRESYILEFLEERKAWVEERRRTHLSLYPDPLHFQTGEEIPLFGSKKKLQWREGEGPSVDRQTLVFPGLPKTQKSRSTKGKESLRYLLGKELHRLVPSFTKRLGIQAERIRIRAMRSHWGICSSDRSLTFNLTLVFCPIYVIEAVVAHEVAHFEHPNHSENFWNLLESWCPDYHKADLWLKQNGPGLICYLL